MSFKSLFRYTGQCSVPSKSRAIAIFSSSTFTPAYVNPAIEGTQKSISGLLPRVLADCQIIFEFHVFIKMLNSH